VEIQLAIFELAIVEVEPLFVNCGYHCTSGNCGNIRAWECRQRHPLSQPALTHACRAIRAETIPMFYQLNTFRAHHFFCTDVRMMFDWLAQTGHSLEPTSAAKLLHV